MVGYCHPSKLKHVKTKSSRQNGVLLGLVAETMVKSAFVLWLAWEQALFSGKKRIES